MAFSPDGALLASGGRANARLWDVATGEQLLTMSAGVYQYALAFSPDGTRLVLGYDSAFKYPGGVRLLRLHNGRGLRSLRGLAARLEPPIFSPDDGLVAALSSEWQIGIWDRRTSELKIVLDAPPGGYPDNASLAIRQDRRRIAFSSDRRARLWDLETGRVLGSWPLPVACKIRWSSRVRIASSCFAPRPPTRTCRLTIPRTPRSTPATAPSTTCWEGADRAGADGP